MTPIRLIIFDLDGVITDEKPYWDSAKEAVIEILRGSEFSAPAIPPDSLPQSLIYWLKNRAINNNWDVAFVAACMVLYSFSTGNPKLASMEFMARGVNLAGLPLLQYAGAKLAASAAGAKERYEYGGALSRLCHQLCQQIHDRRIESGEGRHMGVLPAAELRRILAELHRVYDGRLGVATGRLRTEAIGALETLGLVEYFEPRCIVTFDDIIDAEASMSRAGKPVSLGKPHPFALLKVISPDVPIETLAAAEQPARCHEDVVFIGDTPSDVYAANAARVHSICVTGAVRDRNARQERISQLRAAGCRWLLDSVADLPQFLRNFDTTRLDEEQVGQ